MAEAAELTLKLSKLGHAHRLQCGVVDARISRAPTPPRFIGHRIWMSRTDSALCLPRTALMTRPGQSERSQVIDIAGAPEEIRTPDPQIRSLLPEYAATKDTMNFGNAVMASSNKGCHGACQPTAS